MYQLIVFDWDGTLMDSAQKISNCFQAAARELNLEVPSEQRAKSIIGLGLREGIELLFPNQTSTTIDKIVETYKYYFITADDTEQGMFEGVEQGLIAMADAGALLAVATGKARRGLKRVFDEVGLEHHFVVSRCADETRSKPHPQMLHEILDFTAIDPHKCIMVGDTSFDMEMARNAGVDGLGVSYGVHSEAELRQAHAVDVLDSFQSVLDWFIGGRVSTAYD